MTRKRKLCLIYTIYSLVDFIIVYFGQEEIMWYDWLGLVMTGLVFIEFLIGESPLSWLLVLIFLGYAGIILIECFRDFEVIEYLMDTEETITLLLVLLQWILGVGSYIFFAVFFAPREKPDGFYSLLTFFYIASIGIDVLNVIG